MPSGSGIIGQTSKNRMWKETEATRNMGRRDQESLFREEELSPIEVEQEVLVNSTEYQETATKATGAKLMALLEKQEYRCALSGRKLTPKTAVIDHITPASKGGGNEIENLQWLHKDVNRAKGTLSQEEFIRVCRMVVAYQR